ncbi:MAG: carboxypeptidase-like regulatory domain-containing protein [Planctomycetota bacterium]|jgi:hypothetical protein
MKNGLLPVILLALLLIAGLSVGAYFVMSGDGDDPNGQNSSVSKTDSDGDSTTEVDNPNVNNPNANGSGSSNNNGNGSSNNNGNGGNSSDTTANNGNGSNNGNGGNNATNGNGTGPIEPTPPQPVEPEEEWAEQTFETTVHGTVRYRSDNRPVPGATVTAELADTSVNFGWGGVRAIDTDRSADPAKSKKPKTKVAGKAETDNDGKYTLTLAVTTYRPKSEVTEGESDKNAGDREAFGGEKYDPWASYDNFIVVAKAAGFAPAKSGWLNFTKGEDQVVNLALAIPAMVSGRVIDASDGKGIAGATGSLTLTDQATDGYTMPINFKTDTDGSFKVEVPAGVYTLGVSADGYAEKNAFGTGAKRIDATRGGEVIVGDVSLLKAGSISGIVVEEVTGKPIGNAIVSAEQGGGAAWMRSKLRA